MSVRKRACENRFKSWKKKLATIIAWFWTIRKDCEHWSLNLARREGYEISQREI